MSEWLIILLLWHKYSRIPEERFDIIIFIVLLSNITDCLGLIVTFLQHPQVVLFIWVLKIHSKVKLFKKEQYAIRLCRFLNEFSY